MNNAENITFHVVITMKDGSMFDGIIEGVDRENFTMLVSEPVMMEEDVSYAREELTVKEEGDQQEDLGVELFHLHY